MSDNRVYLNPEMVKRLLGVLELAESTLEEPVFEKEDDEEVKALIQYLRHTSYLTVPMYEGFKEQIAEIFSRIKLVPDFEEGSLTTKDSILTFCEGEE